ncbi:MAG TPA: helix-turn-helix domain-containing protein [Bryobacteraceae bacterium]
MLPPLASQTRTPSADEIRQTLQDLVGHPLLHGSEALCNLLRYLVERSLQHPDHPAKEHQIATEVFGRPQSFDPRVDSTVRVQTSRLRSKLTEYYATAGAGQHWHVEIPKGSYAVLFHERSPQEQPSSADLPPARRFRRSYLLIAAGVVVVLLAVLLPTTVLHPKRIPAVARFWSAVLSTSTPPLIVYSNAEFVGRPETGLRYYNPRKDPADAIFDQYTGVGEVMAVYHLHGTFDELGRSFLLKRGRLLNWDDTKNRDVIFLGSPAENLPLRELPPDHDFTFRRVPGPVGPADLGLINLHPRPGEQKIYFGSKRPPITHDYALIEFSSGAWSRHMLTLAGTTTFGTEAAAEFVCREDKVAHLLSYFKKKHGRIGPFSAVLRVTIAGEVPLDSKIVAFRFD